jgi:hypothetical protein
MVKRLCFSNVTVLVIIGRFHIGVVSQTPRLSTDEPLLLVDITAWQVVNKRVGDSSTDGGVGTSLVSRNVSPYWNRYLLPPWAPGASWALQAREPHQGSGLASFRSQPWWAEPMLLSPVTASFLASCCFLWAWAHGVSPPYLVKDAAWHPQEGSTHPTDLLPLLDI